jgi:flagellar biosynthetic protein FliR
MSIFNFNMEEMLTFFAVLVRFSILFSILPFVGDRVVPVPVKILLSLVISIALFPALVASGYVHPGDANIWAVTPGGIIGTVALEVIFALALGFSARLMFDAISFGGNLVGTFMGFATANTFDPHQESQTQMIAQLQTYLAMLVFLALDGHHLVLRASLESYQIVGLGKANLLAGFSQRLIQLSGDVFRFGLQIAAPVTVSMFATNIVLGIMSKAIPQLNIFMLSFAITTLIGFFVLFLSLPEFAETVGGMFAKAGDWMGSIMLALAGGK